MFETDDRRTWDREVPRECRQSDDYYHSETCIIHRWSYMDSDDTECERKRLYRAQSQVAQAVEQNTLNCLDTAVEMLLSVRGNEQVPQTLDAAISMLMSMRARLAGEVITA